MILLWLLVPLASINSKEIDWTSCIEKTTCFMLDKCKEGGTTEDLVQYPINDAEKAKTYTCDTGFQNKFFTSDVALFQFQVKGDVATTKPELSIYHGDKLFVGCKKNENGVVELIGDPVLKGKLRIVLFEERSGFLSDRAFCSLKLDNMIQAKFDRFMTTVFPNFANEQPEIRYLNSAGQTVKLELPFMGYYQRRNRNFQGIEQCDPFSFQEGTPIENFHVLPLIDKDRDVLDCPINEGVTYTLKSTKEGTSKDLDSLICTASHEYEMKTKGSPEVEILTNAYNYQFSCVAPINRVCTTPFAKCAGEPNCPKFTPGSDADEAKLECPDNKWLINGEYHSLQDSEKPTCREDDVPNHAAFFVNFASGPLRLSESDSVSCFATCEQGICVAKYDCSIKSKLDYSDCKKSDAPACGVLLYSDGIMKCEDPKNYNLSTIQPNSNVSLSVTEFACDFATGEWKGKTQSGMVTLLDDAQVSCVSNKDEETSEQMTSFNEDTKIIIVSVAALVGLAISIPAIYCAYRSRKKWSQAKITRLEKKKWLKMKLPDRIDYVKRTFHAVTNASKHSDLHIVHGFEVIEVLLDTNTEDLEIWDHVYPFLQRVRGAMASIDYNLADLFYRFMFLQAKKIIDKHGWKSTTRITKSKPEGLIRCVAIQLLAHSGYFKYDEEPVQLLENGYRKLGFNGIEQYPHCGLLWFLMTQLHHPSYSNPSDPSMKDTTMDQEKLIRQLNEIATDPPSGLEKDDIFPQFGSISDQAMFALGATMSLNKQASLVRSIFVKLEKADKAKEDKAVNFMKGIACGINKDPGPRLLKHTKRMAHDYEKKAETEGFVAFHEILRSIGPVSAWQSIIDLYTRIMMYNHHTQDVKRLENLIAPDAKESALYLQLLTSQERFEEALKAQIDELWTWLSSRTDLDVLKTRPIALDYSETAEPEGELPLAELFPGTLASLEPLLVKPLVAELMAADKEAAPGGAPAPVPPPSSSNSPSPAPPNPETKSAEPVLPPTAGNNPPNPVPPNAEVKSAEPVVSVPATQ